MSKILEVGDKVLFVGDYGDYREETVVSVTEKRAKLTYKTVLIREYNELTESFIVYGKTYYRGSYRPYTSELKTNLEEKSKRREYESKIDRWFRTFHPDFATKEALYKQFNPETNE